MRDYFVWLLKILTVFVLILVVPIIMAGVMAGISDPSAKAPSGNTVAVIELNGAIESSREVIDLLHAQVDNPKVKGIVLAINSPGGAVGPSQDIYREVSRLKARKPIVAAMSSVAASGGLYAALGASKIYAQPGTITGSIGVILQIPNFTKVAETVGVKMVTIKSGALKDVGNSFRDMTDEEKVFLERTVKEAYDDFVRAVATSRNLPRAKVAQFADGRIILGSTAKEIGLVDAHGSVYDAARSVFELLGSPLGDEEEPKLFYAEDKFAEFRNLFGAIFTPLLRVSQPSMQLRYVMN
jgi:protease-4